MGAAQTIRNTNADNPGMGGLSRWQALNINNYAEKQIKEPSPEGKLFLAILNDAVETVKKRIPKGNTNVGPITRKEWYKAHAWILSDREDWVFSFVPICEYFGWDPKYVRKKILEVARAADEERQKTGQQKHKRHHRRVQNVRTNQKIRRARQHRFVAG